MRTSRVSLKGVAAGLAAILLAAGVAGAAAGTFSTDGGATTTSTTDDVDDTTTTAATTTTEATTTEPSIEPAGETVDESIEGDAGVERITEDPNVDCAPGNHGQTVSSVAKATPSGPGKGAIVAAAAQSDCGKPVGSVDQQVDDEGDQQDDDEGGANVAPDDAATEESDADAAKGREAAPGQQGKSDKPGKGNGG